ncbi:MAG: nif-specific transcriptional activator NifA [Acetobacteraceae bacterium]|jgi:Nif-specific regulatory protein
MIGELDPSSSVPDGHLPGRPEMALYGIYEISKILCGPGNLREILVATLCVLKSFLDMGNGLIALLDAAGEPEIVVSGSLGDRDARRYFDTLPERVIGQLVATEMPMAVADVAKDSVFDWDTSAWGPSGLSYSFMGVPIKSRDHVIGTLTIDRAWLTWGAVQVDEDLRFLKMVANLVGQTVRLHRIVTNDRSRLLEEQSRLSKLRTEILPEAPPRTIGDTRYGGIIGESREIRRVMDMVGIVARTNSTVILRGESGTGKELFAQAVHELSGRATGPFIRLNCAALPESVLESELFGHEKGAFTGAIAQRKGRFELADKGTLFLDEIGEISPAFQAKLLRVLQEGEFERVGGTRTLKVDVRLVAATNRDLEDAVAKGTFRADLYYRITVVTIFVPPLRDRRSDIPLLANEFLRRFNRDNKTKHTLSHSATEVLMSCYFPGNVRELENCVCRTATMARGDLIQDVDFACRNDRCLSSVLWKLPQEARPDVVVPLPVLPSPVRQPPPLVARELVPGPANPMPTADAPDAVADDAAGNIDRDALLAAMEKSGWVQAKAARLLGLTPRQVGYAIRKQGIPIQKF